MAQYIWLIPSLPLLGFLMLVLAGRHMSRRIIACIGAGSVGLSAVISFIFFFDFLSRPAGYTVKQTLWTWFSAGNFAPSISFYLDPLSIVFILIINFVGFLIHFYSIEFMYDEEGYSRFFAYMNLFVGSMLILILAGDFLLMYLGWEGVGLCSYLLIGFWYREQENGWAARKAFIVTRIGDTAMALGLFILVKELMTLDIQDVMHSVSSLQPSSATIAAALLLGGALGKSAQLPLQTWLPDAMAGPTPVSALIHAATMVTAGVYLVARSNVLFQAAPVVMYAVAVIGALTLLIAGFSAVVQTNIKKVLAYSTISQIGYMFLGLGCGAFTASIFHFAIHAFFKALLFLGAGAVIMALEHEHDMRKMGGLHGKLPVVFWTYLIGAASLSAVPMITAGFFSKDLILMYSYTGGKWLWPAGLAGAFITSFYSFRMVFITFFGEAKTKMHIKPGWKISMPLIILAVPAVAAGWIEMPSNIMDLHLFTDFIGPVLPSPDAEISHSLETILQWTASITSLAGILAAYVLYILKPAYADAVNRSPFGKLAPFLYSGCGFDRFYDTLIVKPVIWLSHINRNDFLDKLNRGIAAVNIEAGRGLSRTESGKLRWYAFSIALGAVIIICLAVLL